jgi:hypothetical protein
MHLAIPEDPFVALEWLVGRDLARDGTVFDAPMLGFTDPMPKRLSIEDRLGGEERSCDEEKSAEEFLGGMEREPPATLFKQVLGSRP